VNPNAASEFKDLGTTVTNFQQFLQHVLDNCKSATSLGEVKDDLYEAPTRPTQEGLASLRQQRDNHFQKCQKEALKAVKSLRALERKLSRVIKLNYCVRVTENKVNALDQHALRRAEQRKKNAAEKKALALEAAQLESM